MEEGMIQLKYDLQFFAKDGPGGEKTEEPTSKKLDDARKEGQVAKSKEIGNAFSLLALFLVMKLYLGTMGTRFIEVFSAVYQQIPDVSKMYNGGLPVASLHVLIRGMMFQILVIMAPVLLIGVAIAIICDVAQVKWKPTTKPLQPKFSKVLGGYFLLILW